MSLGVVCMQFCGERCYCSVQCKLCVRSFGSEDPRHNKKGKALTRAGNRGLICDVCRNTLNYKYGGDGQMQRKERINMIVAEVQKNGASTEHNQNVDEWLTESQKSAEAGHTRVTCGPRTSCTVSGSSSMGLRRGHGYIWTASQWSSFFKEDVDWSRVKTYSSNGVKVEGILEPPNKGWIPGLHELYEQHESKTSTDTVVADTSAGNSVEEVRAAGAALAKSRKLSTEITTNDEGEVTAYKVATSELKQLRENKEV